MKFYFKLTDSERRKELILAGYNHEAEEITLYPETVSILHDLETNPDSNFWPVWEPGKDSTVPGDFPTFVEAKHAYYQAEGESIYCIMHDC